MRITALVNIVGLSALLAACSTLRPSTPAPSSGSMRSQVHCIELRRDPPVPMPQGTVAFPHGASYALIPADSATGLLVPLPFVSDLVAGAVARSTAETYQQHMASVDPYVPAVQALSAQTALTRDCKQPPAELRTQVFLMESHDELYRLSLLFELRIGDWMGRYYDHLPTPLTPDELARMSEKGRERLQAELGEGSRLLARLIERDMRGQLPTHGPKYRAGSLYLAGGNIGGLVAPERLVYPGAELLDSDEQTLLLRFAGDTSSPAQAGALLFGVHHFRRQQLHHFQPE